LSRLARPAFAGGTPLRESYLHFHRPTLGREEEREVVAVLRSGWLTTGERTKRFEREFAEFVGAPYAVGVTSCTAALHLACLVSNLGPGDEVITTPMTFGATANVIVHTGARPVFVDVEPLSLNLDAHKIEAAVTRRTRAILPVHYIGQPCDMRPIRAIARRHGLAVIEDAAHAVETVYRGRSVGSISELTAFSFYATKNITTGEGGMLTTKRKSLAERARVLSLHGMSRDAWKRFSSTGFRHYAHVEAGFKYNMFDLQAALGIHQLGRIERLWRARRRAFDLYNRALAGIPGIRPLGQAERPGDKNAYHLYVVRVDRREARISRDGLMAALWAENIGTGVHYRAVHLQPFYRKELGYRPGVCPVAEEASEEVLSLPFYPSIRRKDIEDVGGALRRIVDYSHRRK